MTVERLGREVTYSVKASGSSEGKGREMQGFGNSIQGHAVKGKSTFSRA
jgi:hypothetical protein